MMSKLKFTLFLFVLTSFNNKANAQNTIAQRQAVKETSVPKNIVSVFKKQYPNVLISGWFETHLNYWQNDYSSNWYIGWYGQRSVVIYTYQKPNYYEVEFSDFPGELSRSIYNINGYWYETRTQIKGLPLPIKEALKNSIYNTWELSSMKEKLESPAWPLEIYRFQVSKRNQSHIIRMDAEGNFIQIKELED